MMSKGIELTPIQIKAYENGASMFLFPTILNCYKCSHYVSDYNESDSWELCKNKKSEFYYEDLNNIENLKCSSFEPSLYYSPIQKGDKDIFVQEEFMEVLDRRPETKGEKYYFYKSEYRQEDYPIAPSYNIWDSLENEFDKHIPASQMIKEQSRYSFSECVNVRVVKVQDVIRKYEMLNILGVSISGDIHNEFIEFYNHQLKEQNINKTYEDNDYVFLVEFKR